MLRGACCFREMWPIYRKLREDDVILDPGQTGSVAQETEKFPPVPNKHYEGTKVRQECDSGRS